MNKQDSPHKGNSKDCLAIGVFTVVLLLIIASVVYLIQTTKKDDFAKPFKMVSKWVSDYWLEAKRFIDGRQSTWSTSRKEKEVRKHLRTGHSLYRKKIYRKALQEFAKAIELDPDNYRAYFWRGRAYIKVNRLKEARVDFQMVIKLKPDNTEAYNNLGWLHMQRAEYDESIHYLSKSLELKPNDGWTYYTRGRCYYQKGDLQKALKDSKTSCSLGYKKGCQAYKEYKEKTSQIEFPPIKQSFHSQERKNGNGYFGLQWLVGQKEVPPPATGSFDSRNSLWLCRAYPHLITGPSQHLEGRQLHQRPLLPEQHRRQAAPGNCLAKLGRPYLSHRESNLYLEVPEYWWHACPACARGATHN